MADKPDQPPTCGTCKYWLELPVTLGIRKKRTGECRVGPPGVTGFLNQRGEMAGNVTMYPQPAIDFPACACHTPRIELATHHSSLATAP